MAKRYTRINWQNAPSTATPRNAENLNKMDKGIDDLDDAIELLNQKFSSGSWTPTLAGSAVAGGHAYTGQSGTYVKIGNVVIATYYIVINVGGLDASMSGNLLINGLPFTSNAYARNAVEYNVLNLGTNYANVLATVNPSDNHVTMVKTGNGVAGAYLTAANLASGQAVVFTGSIIYTVS